MKKIILLFIYINFCFCYPNKSYHFYSIKGEEITTKTTIDISINEFQNTFFSDYKFFKTFTVSEFFYDEAKEKGIVAIYYQEFTNKALFIVGNNPTKSQIKAALKKFNFREYLISYEFEHNLLKYSKSKLLMKNDLYNTFGIPAKKTTNNNSTLLFYDHPNLHFTLINDVVTEFIYIKPD